MRPVPDVSAARSWRLVVPVKETGLAKSRLVPPPGVERRQLALAFARDTLAAVTAGIPPAHLVVVTSDPAAAALASAHAALVEADPGAGLNVAVHAGLRRLEAEHGPGPTGVLLADLPALRPEELAAALGHAARHRRAFVPDADGTGTVLLTARAGVPLEPRFGPGSAQAHAGSAERLELDLPTLRTDVDDDASLRRALDLGVGMHTAAALGGPTIDAAG